MSKEIELRKEMTAEQLNHVLQKLTETLNPVFHAAREEIYSPEETEKIHDCIYEICQTLKQPMLEKARKEQQLIPLLSHASQEIYYMTPEQRVWSGEYCRSQIRVLKKEFFQDYVESDYAYFYDDYMNSLNEPQPQVWDPYRLEGDHLTLWKRRFSGPEGIQFTIVEFED